MFRRNWRQYENQKAALILLGGIHHHGRDPTDLAAS
jgi:hypothetical protein